MTPPIRFVSPVYGDDVRASGFQFTCARCDWRSPVMSYRAGAVRHEGEHDCPLAPAAPTAAKHGARV